MPVDQPSDQPSETFPMDDDSLTPLEDSTMDQHSSDSTIQDSASASEENTMELFTEPQTSSRPAGNGRKPAKILDVSLLFANGPLLPWLQANLCQNTLLTQVNLALSLKNRTLVAQISRSIIDPFFVIYYI